MKKLLLLVCAIISLVPFLSGCGRPAFVNVECDEFTQKKNVSREIDVWPSYRVTVYLCSNPSTGFRWSESADISDQSVIQQTSHEFIAPDEPIAKAPGKQIWTFRTKEKGTSTIRMQYSRPWEGGEKQEWTFTLTVTVKY